jgi:ParB family transcriptional regulator, chromosome partitioning protein
MNVKKRGLSRGLNALLANSAVTQSDNAVNIVTNLAINKLVPGKFQPRTNILKEEIKELSDSIKTQGVLQPLIVRQINNDNYEIIAGERRWQAAKIAELKEIPVIIKNASDKDALTIGLIENIQRENLNPIEEAIALDKLAKEFFLTHNEIAFALGKSRTTISNLLRILALPKEVKKMLEERQLDLGHAKVLLSAPINLQLKIANKIIEDNLSVRDTELLLTKFQAVDLTHANNIKNKVKSVLDPDIKKLQKNLSDTLGTKVTIVTKAKGRGKLVIEYNNLEELEGILEHIAITEDL